MCGCVCVSVCKGAVGPGRDDGERVRGVGRQKEEDLCDVAVGPAA